VNILGLNEKQMLDYYEYNYFIKLWLLQRVNYMNSFFPTASAVEAVERAKRGKKLSI